MRRYSDEFKKELVSSFESGKFSVPQLEKLYGVGNVSSTDVYINFLPLMKKDLELLK